MGNNNVIMKTLKMHNGNNELIITYFCHMKKWRNNDVIMV